MPTCRSPIGLQSIFSVVRTGLNKFQHKDMDTYEVILFKKFDSLTPPLELFSLQDAAFLNHKLLSLSNSTWKETPHCAAWGVLLLTMITLTVFLDSCHYCWPLAIKIRDHWTTDACFNYANNKNHLKNDHLRACGDSYFTSGLSGFNPAYKPPIIKAHSDSFWSFLLIRDFLSFLWIKTALSTPRIQTAISKYRPVMFLIKQLYYPQSSSTLGENQLDRPFRHTLIHTFAPIEL